LESDVDEDISGNDDNDSVLSTIVWINECARRKK
jgi:hypothetical protein